MVAAVVKALGVDLGISADATESGKPYEDHEDKLVQGFLNPQVWRQLSSDQDPTNFDLAELDRFESEVIKPRTSAHRTWGWKYPGTVFWLMNTDLRNRLTNPYFILVHRPAEAVWRSERKHNQAFKEEFRHGGHPNAPGLHFGYVTRQQNALHQFEQSCIDPLFTVEFEEVRASDERGRRDFVRAIGLFLGLEADTEVIDHALAQMDS